MLDQLLAMMLLFAILADTDVDCDILAVDVSRLEECLDIDVGAQSLTNLEGR